MDYTFNQSINNCIDILLDCDLIDYSKSYELRARVADNDETAYKEIQDMLERFSGGNIYG